MEKYSNMPRNELIAELKAWEGKFDCKVNEEVKKHRGKLQSVVSKLEDAAIKEYYYDRVAKMDQILREHELTAKISFYSKLGWYPGFFGSHKEVTRLIENIESDLKKLKDIEQL